MVLPVCWMYAVNALGLLKLSDEGQVEALKAGVLGSGTLYGVDQTQRSDDRYRDAYARCMRSRGYSR